MSENPLPPHTESSEDLEDKQRGDFFWGLFGSIVVNLILYLLFTNEIIPNLSSLIWLPWTLNIVGIIVFLVIRRPAIVLGILASYGLALAIALCFGLATCFGGI